MALSSVRLVIHLLIIASTILIARKSCCTKATQRPAALQEPLLSETDGASPDHDSSTGLVEAWVQEETSQQKVRDSIRRRKNIFLYTLYGTVEMATAVYGGTKVVMTPASGFVANGLLVLSSFMPYFCYSSLTYMLRYVGEDPGRYFVVLHEEHVLQFYDKGTYTGRRIRCDTCRVNATRLAIYLCTKCRYGVCVKCLQKRYSSLAGLEEAAGIKPGEDMPGPVDNNSIAVKVYISRMFAFVSGKQFTLLILACVSLIVQSTASVLLPRFQGKSLDGVIAKDETLFHQAMFNFLAASAAIVLFGTVRNFLFTLLGRYVTTNIRELLFEQMLKQDLAFFEDASHKTGALLARLTSDVDLMCSPIRGLLNSLLSASVNLGGGLFMCFWTSWRLSAMAFTTIWPMMYIARTYGYWSAGIYREIQASKAEANSVASEAFSNIRTVKAFSTELYESGQYRSHIRVALRKGVQDAIASAGSYGLYNIADVGASFVILWFGGTVVLNMSEHLTIGGLITFELYWNKVNNSFSALNSSLTTVMAAVGGSQRVFKLLFNLDQSELEKPSTTVWFAGPNGHPVKRGDKGVSDEASRIMSRFRVRYSSDTQPSTAFGNNEVVISSDKRDHESMSGNLTLENVEFAYGGRKKQVLNGVSIDIASNKTLAIVGHSGSGKSTLTSLMLGLYRPTGGTIYVDAHNLQNCDQLSFHRNVGVVLQTTELFARSILENLTYGLREDEWSMDDVITACKRAFCHDFIMSFDDKYRTAVGERGTQLSGGERQRIAIARALLRKPKLLFLDEATSSLDGTSEEIVQKAMQALLDEGDSTIVLVAHRLSSFRQADAIIVMKQGEVVETGNHDTLLAQGGEYAKLVLPQLHSDNKQ